MNKPISKKIWRVFRVIILLYVIIGVTLYFIQEKFLFHPESLPDNHVFAFAQPFEEIKLPINKERTLSIVRFKTTDSIRKGVVVYFHGNRQNIERYARFTDDFTKHGYDVLMCDYPGFGKTTGERTEKIMLEDAMTVYEMARSIVGKDSIILYGKSMGTGLACYVASQRNCQQVILETPYYSIDALMRHYAPIYPVSLMTHFHFPSSEYIGKIIVPVTIFHGTNDEVIPFKHAGWLKDKAKSPVTIIAIKGGNHNNLADFPLFHQQLAALLAH